MRGDMNGTPSIKQRGMLHSKIAQAALLSLLIIAFSAALWRTSHSRVSDPVFDGKPLSAWLRSYFDYDGMWPRDPPESRTKQVDLAIRQIGTNSIPLLVSMLSAKDSRLKAALLSIMRKQHWVKIHITSAEERLATANLGFRALGAAAKPAIPALAELINDPTTSGAAIGSLSDIGADAIPVLARALTNRNASVRADAISGLRDIKGSAREIIPLLIDRLKDKDPLVRGRAAEAFRVLEVFDEQPQAVVSGLIELLDDTNDWPRRTAAESLGQFREKARAAIPKLLAALKDRNQQVRKSAAVSLWLIDAEVAAKAGIDVFRDKYGE
jgi:hypothetical protein